MNLLRISSNPKRDVCLSRHIHPFGTYHRMQSRCVQDVLKVLLIDICHDTRNSLLLFVLTLQSTGE